MIFLYLQHGRLLPCYWRFVVIRWQVTSSIYSLFFPWLPLLCTKQHVSIHRWGANVLLLSLVEYISFVQSIPWSATRKAWTDSMLFHLCLVPRRNRPARVHWNNNSKWLWISLAIATVRVCIRFTAIHPVSMLDTCTYIKPQGRQYRIHRQQKQWLVDLAVECKA